MVRRTETNAATLCGATQLEYAGIAGTCIVGTLVIIVAHSSLVQGLPAVHSGDFPIFGISDIGAALWWYPSSFTSCRHRFCRIGMRRCERVWLCIFPAAVYHAAPE